MRLKLLGFIYLILFLFACSLNVSAFDTLPRPVTICSGANIVVKGDEISLTPDVYRWEFYQNGTWAAAPGVNNASDYLTTSLVNPTTQDMTYNMRRLKVKGGITELDSYYIITVQPILPITSNTIVQPVASKFCGSGSPATITGATPISGNAAIMYQWQRAADDINFTNIDGANAKDYIPGLITASTYYRRVAMSGGCGLSSISNSVFITVIPSVLRPVTEVTSLVICAGSNATLSVKSPLTELTYNWYTAASGGVPIGVGNNWLTPKIAAKTTYYLEAVNKEGCNYPERQAITVDVWPVLAAPVVTVELTTHNSITFKWNAVSGATGYRVTIDRGVTYQIPSSGEKGLTHSVTGLKAGETAAIQVVATGEIDCQRSGNSALTVAETTLQYDGIFVPNAFTPNNDGRNDIVYVRGETVKTLQFYIYSPWGAQLFYSDKIIHGWDGSSAGAAQPMGVYLYALKAVMNNGTEINKKGTITLIR